MSMKRRRFLGLLGAMAAVPVLGPLVPAVQADAPREDLLFKLHDFGRRGVSAGESTHLGHLPAEVERAYLTSCGSVMKADGWRKIPEGFEFTFTPKNEIEPFTSGMGMATAHDFYLMFKEPGEMMREFKVIGTRIHASNWPFRVWVKFNPDGKLFYSGLSWTDGSMMGVSHRYASTMRVHVRKLKTPVYEPNGETSV